MALPNRTMGAVIDLTDVEYLDSAAIRLLFELASTTRTHGQALRIAVPADSLTRALLGRIALDAALPIDPDPASALARMQEPDTR